MEVDVWLVDLGSGDKVQRRAVAHDALRRAAASVLGVAPEAVDLRHEASGRPVVDGLHVSLSHSGELGAAAVAGAPVGVDVEAGGRSTDVHALARRWFTAHEQAVLADAADPAGAFLAMWTVKEAVLKAHGRGITDGLDRVRTDLADGVPVLLGVGDEPGGAWTLVPLPVGPSSRGAVAVHAPAAMVRVHRGPPHGVGP